MHVQYTRQYFELHMLYSILITFFPPHMYLRYKIPGNTIVPTEPKAIVPGVAVHLIPGLQTVGQIEGQRALLEELNVLFSGLDLGAQSGITPILQLLQSSTTAELAFRKTRYPLPPCNKSYQFEPYDNLSKRCNYFKIINFLDATCTVFFLAYLSNN